MLSTFHRIPDLQTRDALKQFMDNDSFKRWLADMVFGITYKEAA